MYFQCGHSPTADQHPRVGCLAEAKGSGRAHIKDSLAISMVIYEEIITYPAESTDTEATWVPGFHILAKLSPTPGAQHKSPGNPVL